MKQVDMKCLPPKLLVELIYPKKQSVDIIKKYFHESNIYTDGGWLIRPIMNLNQVLGDYSFLPDGLVWNVGFMTIKGALLERSVGSDTLKELAHVSWVSCIGVTHEYAEWGAARGMEVINV